MIEHSFENSNIENKKKVLGVGEQRLNADVFKELILSEQETQVQNKFHKKLKKMKISQSEIQLWLKILIELDFNLLVTTHK